MAKSDPEALAAALRENLKRRKERMRAAQAEHEEPAVRGSTDEEGDVPPPREGEKPGAWVSIGSKKP
ncbi:MAG: hypothetical protein V4530_16870 [Pseudomonadota bacterium]